MPALTAAKSNSSNFFSSFFFLPPLQRQAMNVIYAFCRHVDDLADENRPHAREELGWWRRAIEKACAGGEPEGLSTDFVAVIRNYGIPFNYFDELLLGVESDLAQTRYATFDELYRYCYRVASVVGLMSLRVFGATRRESQFFAINLGVALQLTNILRDVGEDYSRGRVYLPQDEMKRFGYTERDLHHRAYNQAFLRLMRFQAERARQFYRRADGHAYTEDWKKLAAAQIMQATYEAILGKIEESDYAVFENDFRLGPFEKKKIALAAYAKNRTASFFGVGKE